MTSFQQDAIVILPKGRDSTGESTKQLKKAEQATPHQQLVNSL